MQEYEYMSKNQNSICWRSALISSLSETGAVGHGELAGGALQAGQGDGVHVGGGGGHRGLRQPVQQVLPLPLSRVIV